MHVSPITPPSPYVDAWTSPSPDEEPDVDEKPPAASIKDPVWQADPWQGPKGPAKEEDIINFIPIRPA